MGDDTDNMIITAHIHTAECSPGCAAVAVIRATLTLQELPPVNGPEGAELYPPKPITQRVDIALSAMDLRIIVRVGRRILRES